MLLSGLDGEIDRVRGGTPSFEEAVERADEGLEWTSGVRGIFGRDVKPFMYVFDL